MIKVNDVKVTANEFAKLFLDRNLQVLVDNMDYIMGKNPEAYDSLTANEKKMFIEFVGKKIGTVRRTLGVEKLKAKIGTDKKPVKKSATKKVTKKPVKKATKKPVKKTTRKVAKKKVRITSWSAK